MKFKTLILENIRSYENGHIDFEDGENLLFGLNGAGKSTILQGVFGGLFQTKMKYQVGNEFDLPDLVRTQADEGRIELVFEAGGAEYTVEWVIQKSYDDDGEVNGAKTKQGYPKLSSDALPEDIYSLGDVQTEIQRVVGMDAESFVNSVYVQQGDITRLIHASTEDRRKILDGLLGLNRLDEYVDRMEDARREYKKAKRDSNSRLDETKKRLQDLPAEEEVQSQINETNKKISEIKGGINDLESKIDGLEDERETKTETLDRIDDLQAELDETRDKYEDAESDHETYKDELQEEKEAQREAEDARDEAQEDLEDLAERDELSDYDVLDADTAEQAHLTAQEEAEMARSERQSIEEGRLNSLQSDLDRIESDIEEAVGEIESKESELDDARDEVESAESRKSDAEKRVERLETSLENDRTTVADLAVELDIPRDASVDDIDKSHIPETRQTISSEREQVVEKKSHLGTLQEQVDDLESEGECPVCGATDDAHDIDSEAVAAEHEANLEAAEERLAELDEAQETLDDLREAVRDAKSTRNDLEDARGEVEQADSDIEDAEARVDEVESTLEGLRGELEEYRSEKERLNDEIDDANEDLEDAEARVNRVETVEELLSEAVELHGRISELESGIDRHEENRERIGELRRTAYDRMSDLKENVEELEAELGDLDAESIRDDINEIDEYLDEFRETLDEKESEQERLVNKLASFKSKKEQIQEETKRKKMLASQREWANQRIDEATEVITKYKEVRGKLRQQNIYKLNEYTNEVFSDLYRDQSYRGVHIDKKYNIHLITQDGEKLKPQLSSGGESGILNLALRAGVYKIITERDGVAGAALPPFILDEPTTFLDSGHVSELQTMIQTIGEWNVPQILLVTHDETLIENSDHAILVKKDPQTETSRVRSGHSAVEEATNDTEAEATAGNTATDD
jgi:exonuclease SbcC